MFDRFCFDDDADDMPDEVGQMLAYRAEMAREAAEYAAWVASRPAGTVLFALHGVMPGEKFENHRAANGVFILRDHAEVKAWLVDLGVSWWTSAHRDDYRTVHEVLFGPGNLDVLIKLRWL
jgi:hypothetical protein